MRNARVLGNYIRVLAGETGAGVAGICDTLGCTEAWTERLLAGYALLRFDDLSRLAGLFGVSEMELLDGGVERYERDMAALVGPFTDLGNREFVLDLIEDYVNVREAVGA